MQFVRDLFRIRANLNRATSRDPAQDLGVCSPHTRIGWATDVGIQRRNNEDSVLVITGIQEGNEIAPDFEFFAVADGMGGHRAGEIASSIAARTVAELVTRHFYLPRLAVPDRSADQQPLNEMLTEAVQLANKRVVEQAPGAGTTLTCALLIGRKAYIAHVGDSRAYLLQDHNVEQITQDHSLVERLVELGQLTRDEAEVHPQKNVLYRAVGQGGALDVDTVIRDIPEGGALLVCTDGLWGMVGDEAIAQIVSDLPTPRAACQELVAAANRAGGRDNITAVVAIPH